VKEFRDHGPRRRPIVTEAGYDLTSREWQVLGLLREGRSTAQIAERLFVSHATVRSHVAALLRKLRVPNRDALRKLER
jgi:DNA-binding NarL/FixJ family response regulator